MTINTIYPERQETIDTLRELVGGMTVGMLTTTGPEGKLRSRPLMPARHEFDGDLWFFVLATSPLCSDIRQQPNVNVAYATPTKDQFVTLSGTAQIVTDRQKMELLWREDLRKWFADGLMTPDLVLLRVSVDEAEFWDKRASGTGGFLSSMISWKGTFELVHEKVGWSEEPAPDMPQPGIESATRRSRDVEKAARSEIVGH